jgi:hypothetical protein
MSPTSVCRFCLPLHELRAAGAGDGARLCRPKATHAVRDEIATALTSAGATMIVPSRTPEAVIAVEATRGGDGDRINSSTVDGFAGRFLASGLPRAARM